MAIRLQAPPVVSQGNKGLWCWAAALSSWVKAVFGETISAEDLVKRFQETGAAGREGGLKPEKAIPELAALFCMDADPPLGSNPPLKVGGGSLSEDYLQPILKNHQHALVFYTETPRGFSHTVVVYGVTENDIYYMDPSPGVLTSKKIYEFPGVYFLTLFAKPNYTRSRWTSSQCDQREGQYYLHSELAARPVGRIRSSE